MPEDAKFPFEYDESGDVASVTGEDFYYLHAQQLALIATEDIKGTGLTETDLVVIRDTISKTVSNSPYFEEPVNVDVIDSSGEELQAQVDANNVSQFEITI